VEKRNTLGKRRPQAGEGGRRVKKRIQADLGSSDFVPIPNNNEGKGLYYNLNGCGARGEKGDMSVMRNRNWGGTTIQGEFMKGECWGRSRKKTSGGAERDHTKTRKKGLHGGIGCSIKDLKKIRCRRELEEGGNGMKAGEEVNGQR